MSKAILLATALLLLAVFEGQAQQPHLRASVLSVGANGTGGGGILLQSTLGQAAVGASAGSAYQINAGFWYQAQPPVAAALTTPVLLTPEDGAVVDPRNGVQVAWQAVPGAAFYFLEVATDEAFASVVVTMGDFPDTTRTLQGLQDNTRYFWRVQAYSGSNLSVFSAPFRFSTGTIVATEDEAGVPEAFTLHPNYPNPFNPTTTLVYDLPQAGPVRLAVYDLFGREVARLVDARQAAGRHEVPFDAGDLASGVYLYRLEAGRFRGVGRMMLVK